jgi:hypothetical protein
VLPCRGCYAHRQRPSDPTLWRSTPGCCVRDRRATALGDARRRCRRASVRLIAEGAQPRSATPDLRGRAGPRDTRANGNIHAASSGSPALPRIRRSAATSLDGQGGNSMRGREAAGISPGYSALTPKFGRQELELLLCLECRPIFRNVILQECTLDRFLRPHEGLLIIVPLRLPFTIGWLRLGPRDVELGSER